MVRCFAEMSCLSGKTTEYRSTEILLKNRGYLGAIIASLKRKITALYGEVTGGLTLNGLFDPGWANCLTG